MALVSRLDIRRISDCIMVDTLASPQNRDRHSSLFIAFPLSYCAWVLLSSAPILAGS